MSKAFFLPANDHTATILELNMDWNLTQNNPVVFDAGVVPEDWVPSIAAQLGLATETKPLPEAKITFAVDRIGVISHPEHKAWLVMCFFLIAVPNKKQVPQAPVAPVEN